MTPARVRACSRFARRAMKLGASASWRSNTLRFTTMIVSIVAAGDWPHRRTGGPTVSSAAAVPTASLPVRRTAVVLLEQINALVQRIGHVASGVVPFRKVQGRVHTAGDLSQAARRERERAPDRVRLQGAAQARHGGVRGKARGRGPKRVRDVLAQVARAPQVQRESERVLVSLPDSGIEVESGEGDRKSTRLNSSHGYISYAVFCLKKKKTTQ